MRPNTVMHAIMTAASFPPLNTGPTSGCWLAGAAAVWAEGVGMGVERSAPPEASAEVVDWLGTVEPEPGVLGLE